MAAATSTRREELANLVTSAQLLEVRWLCGEVTCVEKPSTMADLSDSLRAARGLPSWTRIHLVVGGQHVGTETTTEELMAGGSVTAVASSQLLALTGGRDRLVRLWGLEAGGGKCISVFEGHTGTVRSISADFSRYRAASGAEDGEIRIWNLAADTASETSPCTAVLAARAGPVLAVVADFELGVIVAGGGDRRLRVWHLDCLDAPVALLQGHLDEVQALAYGGPAGSRRLISASLDRTLRVWAGVCRSGQPPAVCEAVLAGHTGGVRAVAADFDRCRAVSGGNDFTIRVWDLDRRECVAVLADVLNSPVVSLCFDATAGGRLIARGLKGTTAMWDAASLDLVSSPGGHDGHAAAAADFSRRRVVSGGNEDGSIKIVGFDDFEDCAVILNAHDGPVRAIAL